MSDSKSKNPQMGEPNQTILAVDENGEFQGEYIPKEAGHTGTGHRHLAITVLLFNDQDEVLLQRRKHQVFDDIWDMTGATHPLHREDGTDETVEEATWRCLNREYGISEKIPLKNYGFFDYFAQYDDVCENEHCAMMVGEYSGKLKLNNEVGYGYKWMYKKEFLEDLENNPTDYSPWAIEGIKLLKEKGFFS